MNPDRGQQQVSSAVIPPRPTTPPPPPPAASGRPTSCKQIPDETFLAAVDEAARLRDSATATRWDVAAILAGHPWFVGREDPDGWPQALVLAKARKLIARGLMAGCGCGCRGDWGRP